MGDVFISYSRRDKPFVRRLHEALSKEYDDVWVDWEDIPSAADWWDEIKEGIEGADTFLLVVTPDSVRSEIVSNEINHAVSHNKRFIPVIYREIVDDDDKAAMHSAIKTHNWILFHEDDAFDESFQQLVTTINTDLTYVRMHTRLLVRAREWSTKNHESSYLLDGSEIREAETWLTEAIGKTLKPTDLHTEYIFESRKLQNGRQRQFLLGAGVAVVVALILMVVAIFFSIEATNNAEIAELNEQNALLARETSDANYIIAQTAGAEALVQADIAETNAQDALIAQATSEFNADKAETSVAIANAEGTNVAVERDRAEQAEAQAVIEADRAVTNEAQAIIAQSTSDANYLFALTQEARAQIQADIASTNEQNALLARETSDANFVVAQTNGAEALVQADIASTNEQDAVEAQATSDFNAQVAETSVAIANAEGTNVAVERDRAEQAEEQAVSNEAQAVNARQTSDANYLFALTQEARAIINAQLAIDAQQTAEYNAEQALSQALAFNSSEAIEFGNYDLALALALESASLNPNLVQTQQLINQLVYASPRFSFENSRTGEISPNEAWVVSSQNTVATIHDLATRAVYRVFEGHEGRINDATFSPDNTILATASEDETIILWDIDSGNILHRLEGHTGAVNDIEFTPDGTQLLSGSDDNTAILWNVSTGAMVQPYNGTPFPIIRLRFGRTSARFYTWHRPSANEEIMSIWEIGNNQPRSTVDDRVYRAFDPIARTAVAGGYGGNSAVVYTAPTLAIQRELTTGFNWANEEVTAFGFRPENGAELMMGIYDGANGTYSLLLVNVATQARVYLGNGTILNEPQIIPEQIDAIGFHPNADQALVATGGIMTLIDVNTGAELQQLAGHNDTITSIEYSPSGNYAISRSRDNNARIWDTNNIDPVEVNRYVAETAFPIVNNPGISPDNALVYAPVETSMFIWNTLSAQRINSIGIGDILNVVYSPTDPYALIVTQSVAFLYDMEMGEYRYNDINVGSGRLHGAATISRDGQFMVVQGNSIYMWAINDRQPIQTFSTDNLPPQAVVTDMELTPDNRYLIVATGYPTNQNAIAEDLIVYAVETGEEVQRFGASGHNRTITNIAISPDSAGVVTASEDGTLVLWNIETGRQQLRFTGHTEAVNVVRFRPDGQTILSASDDTDIIMWSLENGQPIRRFDSHTEPVTGLNISTDGTLAVSSTGGDTLIVWRIEELASVIAWAYSERNIRELTCAERLQFNVLPLCEFD